MQYGKLPKIIGEYYLSCQEMLFYQYLPVKLIGGHKITLEQRLDYCSPIIGSSCCDFIGTFGLDRFVNSYVYLSVKSLFQPKNISYNRPGWHCDGFMTDDINYIWSDKNPTVFNNSQFSITLDDIKSIEELEQQALSENNITYPNNSLVRLDQYNVHKVSDVQEEGVRNFIKISISQDKYDLIGNSKNYLLKYDWPMRQRSFQRNTPQSLN